jgi:hypothetical protein
MLDHRDDIDSDFSAIHRIRDPENTLSGPEYFNMAERLPYFAGVLQGKGLEEQEAAKKRQGKHATQGQSPAMGEAATAGKIETNPSTAGLIEWE